MICIKLTSKIIRMIPNFNLSRIFKPMQKKN